MSRPDGRLTRRDRYNAQAARVRLLKGSTGSLRGHGSERALRSKKSLRGHGSERALRSKKSQYAKVILLARFISWTGPMSGKRMRLFVLVSDLFNLKCSRGDR
jgi:hypothetical protein